MKKKLLVLASLTLLLSFASCASEVSSSSSSSSSESSQSSSSSSSSESSSTSSSSSSSEVVLDGNGTKESPYIIKSAEELEYFAKSYNEQESAPKEKVYYELGNDIDLNGVDHLAIGTSEIPFNGRFDGRGHKITNFKISKYDLDVHEYGLFGVTDEAVIKDVDIDIDYDFAPIGKKSSVYVGGLVAKATNTPIYNIDVTGSIKLTSAQNSSSYLVVGSVAGIVSSTSNYFVSLQNSTAKVNISNNMTNANDTVNISGGIVGAVSNESFSGAYAITSCYYNGSIFAEDAAGGIVGVVNTYTSILDCVTEGDTISVSSSDGGCYAGGILGQGYYYTAVLNNYAEYNYIDAVGGSSSTVYKPYGGGIVGFAYESGYDVAYDILGTTTYSNYSKIGELNVTELGYSGETVPSGTTIKEAVGLSSYWTIDGEKKIVSEVSETEENVKVKLDANYEGSENQNEELNFVKGAYDSSNIVLATNKKFTREHYSYSGLYYDKDGKAPYCFFAPILKETTLYAGYGDLSNLVGKYNYTVSGLTTTGSWGFDEEYFYWEYDYDVMKYEYKFDGKYIFIGDYVGSDDQGFYEGEMLILNEDGTLTTYDINDSDYVLTGTKVSSTYETIDYTNKSFLGDWKVNDDKGTYFTLNANGNGYAYNSSSTTKYTGGYRYDEATSTLDIKLTGRYNEKLTYDEEEQIMYGAEGKFVARTLPSKTYASTDNKLFIYVYEDSNKTYAIYEGQKVTFTGELKDGEEIEIGEGITYEVKGNSLISTKEEFDENDCGTYIDEDNNVLTLKIDGTGTFSVYSFSWSKKKGTISSFLKYDSDKNTIVFNSDGSISVHLESADGNFVYDKTLTKKTKEDSSSPAYCGTWTFKTPGATFPVIFNADGTGLYNGTKFNYTVSGSNITFSVGDIEVSLTYTESSDKLSGSFEQDYETYYYSSITRTSK